MNNPNIRIVDCCGRCKYRKVEEFTMPAVEKHSYYMSWELKCTKHDCIVYEFNVCDDFEGEIGGE